MARFTDIIGQKMIVDHLKNVVENDQVSHAYIICGERYAGKEFIANVFAMALLCEEEGTEPCNECHSCKQALSKNNPDIIYLTHEKPNVISVDDIREQVGATIAVKPYAAKRKIYIISEAEKMNNNAQNALLKTLEEPPEYAVLILLTDNLGALLPTIQSRCVVLNMKPADDRLVKKFLMEEEQIPDYRAEICAAFARGNIGKAKILARSEEFEKIKTDAIAMLKHIHEMDISELSQTIKQMNEYKLEISDFLDILAVWYRDALLFKATNDANHLIFRDEFQNIKRTASRSTYEGIENILAALDTAKKRITANVNFDLTMELLLLSIKENSDR
ncbi:MAG: DNA polymerase III subunit delta [Lachnospiraceae bacterium]|nr:DNA polymerase III subunit delta [Lachnospiraceae bacterium]